jgi:uncharacterized protein (TIGR02678 family)
MSGLEPELRAEGAALVDPSGDMSDAALPAEGTQAHATLLVAQFLAERLGADPSRQASEAEIAAYLRRAADRYGRYWKKSARDPGAETGLARDALTQLLALKLVRYAGEAIEARPALLRFAFGDPRFDASSQREMDLA